MAPSQMLVGPADSCACFPDLIENYLTFILTHPLYNASNLTKRNTFTSVLHLH